MNIVEKNDYIEITTKSGVTYKVDSEYRMYFEHLDWYSGYYNYLCINNNGIIKRFHRIIMDCPKGMVVDHINRDVTDNRKSNLRNVTPSQNMRNIKNLSGNYKGVSWSKSAKKWRCTISINKKQKHLGYFDCEKEAARTYDNYVLNELGGIGYINGV